MHERIKRIAIAGSGNVAWHLAKGLLHQDFSITGIWSRDYSNALDLAESCTSVAHRNISDLCADTDMIIIAVADKAIEEVAGQIGKFNGIVVHTAGSVSIDIFKGRLENYGVFYPLQTFSKAIPVDLRSVPFFLESSSEKVLTMLEHVASTLTARVYKADSHQRMLLHIAAVFAGNYSNLMYIIGNEILKNSNIQQEALHALILETARKAVTSDPVSIQTGPARRKDNITIEKHIETLASLPEYAELYRHLANLISDKY